MCGSAPSAPQLPAYPSLTPAQQTNLGQQAGISQQFGNVVQGATSQLGANQNILQQIAGLFNADGTINQNAVTQLQQMTQGQTSAAGAAGTQALSGLGGTNNALAQTQQAYTSALEGKGPANQQLQYQQQQNFMAMQEQAAQQGIKITGTDWSNAVSDSTAGQKLIQNFQQNANIQNQQYQLGYLGQLGTNMGQLAGVGAQQAATGTGLAQYAQGTPLGYLGQSISGGLSALAPLLSSYQGQLSSAYEPLYMQQIGPYEQQLAQAQANYQGSMGQYNASQNQLMGWGQLGGQLLGGASFGGGFGQGGKQSLLGYAFA